MANTLLDLFANFTNCLFCFPSSPLLKINGRSFRMLRLLGEGGFSYVYLVQDVSDSSLYALKKIRCPFGQESVSLALKEVEAYSLFKGLSGGEYVIGVIGHEVRDEGGRGVSGIGTEDGARGGNKTVYILLPYYRQGNLQDAINANLVNHKQFGERHLMQLMIGVCKGLRAMHQYRVGSSTTSKQASAIRQQGEEEDADAARRKARAGKRVMTADQRHHEEIAEEQGEALLPEDAGGEVMRAQAGKKAGETQAYAHRDIKPANIMIDDDGVTPILMDLGSLAPSPTPITSRSIALAVQDQAAEHSTMPYRAPELFDVKTGSVIDTKVDIWSLGCTMYACLVGKSPFEARSDETGGSLSICVLGGDWRWPDDGKKDAKGKLKAGNQQSNGTASGGEPTYPSQGVREIVRRCLLVEPSERPDVDQLQKLIEDVLNDLPKGDLSNGLQD